MLGARLKSWMEAQLGRAKRRKAKQARAQPPPETAPPPHLSSPESAYSTGYSTDGTSPGAPPATLAAPLVAPPPPPAPPTTHLYHEPAKRHQVSLRRVPEVPVICATPSPRPRCRIKTNPWLGGSPTSRRRQVGQQSGQVPQAAYGLDSKFVSRSPNISPLRSPYYRCGASSDEECRNVRTRGRETAILSDAEADSDGDTGLDGGDEDEADEFASPSRRRARRRRPRRAPRSAGATPPRARRRHPPPTTRDPLLEADREAERKYRELIREAERLLVSVSRAPVAPAAAAVQPPPPPQPPHYPRVRQLREVDVPRRSPEKTHITNFMRANSPEPPRRVSPAPRQSPLAAPQPPPLSRRAPPGRPAPPAPARAPHPPPPAPCAPTYTYLAPERPHSEPPKRKAYARDEVLQTLEGLRRSLQQQSALLAVQRTRLDSL